MTTIIRANPKNKYGAIRTTIDGIREPVRASFGAGKAAQWIFENVGYDGSDCLIWPFARSTNGYGSLSFQRRRRSAHRMMCEAAHGGPPFDGALATHSCGNGHKGCVNPRHLVWGTASKNLMDRVAHGTHARGTRCYSAKLTEQDVIRIRALKGFMSEDNIAKRYGVSRGTIACVMQRRTWAWL